jgi:hypothetical protein
VVSKRVCSWASTTVEDPPRCCYTPCPLTELAAAMVPSNHPQPGPRHHGPQPSFRTRTGGTSGSPCWPTRKVPTDGRRGCRRLSAGLDGQGAAVAGTAPVHPTPARPTTASGQATRRGAARRRVAWQRTHRPRAPAASGHVRWRVGRRGLPVALFGFPFSVLAGPMPGSLHGQDTGRRGTGVGTVPPPITARFATHTCQPVGTPDAVFVGIRSDAQHPPNRQHPKPHHTFPRSR